MRSTTLRKRGLQKYKKSRKSRRVQRGGLCPVGCIADPEYHSSNSASNSNSVPLTEDEEKCSVNVFTVGSRGKTTIFFKDFKNSIKPINDFIKSKTAFRNEEKAEIIEYVNTNLQNITNIVNNADKLLKSSLCNEEAKKSIKSLLKPLYDVYPYTMKPVTLKNVISR
jgi:hypothetical protein